MCALSKYLRLCSIPAMKPATGSKPLIALIINKTENRNSLFMALPRNGFHNGKITDFCLNINNYIKYLNKNNGNNGFFSIHPHIALKISKSGGSKIKETCISKNPLFPLFLYIYIIMSLESLSISHNGFFKKSVTKPLFPL